MHFFQRGSIRGRLTLWNVGVLALTLAVLGAALHYTLKANLMRGADRDLARFADRAQRIAAVLPAALPRPLNPSDRNPYGPRFLTVTGKPFSPTSETTPWDSQTFAQSVQGRSLYSTATLSGEPVRIYSVPLRQGEKIIGVAQVARPLAEEYAEVRRVTRTLLTLIPLALLIAGGGGAFLTSRALRPVRQITQAAGQIGAGDLSERLPVTGQDEMAELARTFNGMLGRLEEAFVRLTQAYEQQQRFTADASHELRTPLTTIKANTSLALLAPHSDTDRRALEAIDKAADRTIRLVQDLLLLARADAGEMRLSSSPLRVQDLLAEVQEAAPASGPKVVVDVAEPALTLFGDAEALGRLLGNLVANAARHTPPEGWITLRGFAAGERVLLQVADTGEGIAPEHLAHLGERFYRVDAARSGAQGGTGLGLAICRSIAEAHGGVLTLESVVGQGTTATVRLPE